MGFTSTDSIYPFISLPALLSPALFSIQAFCLLISVTCTDRSFLSMLYVFQSGVDRRDIPDTTKLTAIDFGAKVFDATDLFCFLTKMHSNK